MSTVSLIIPFRNEKEYAVNTINGVMKIFKSGQVKGEIIVVDDSTDGTYEILKKLERKYKILKVMKGSPNPGYGKALRKGYKYAAKDIVIPFNGDLSDSPEDVVRYTNEIDGYDMVFGSRYIKGGKIINYPKSKLWASILGNIIIKLFFGVNVSDLTNSFKAYRKYVLKNLELESDGFEISVETPLKAIQKGYTYKQIPVTWYGREFGQTKMSLARSIFKHLRTFIKVWLK